MIIHWFPLLCGLFLGLTPATSLVSSECRYLRFESVWARVTFANKSGQRRRRWWKMPLVWIDPFRGYVVAMQLGTAFAPVDEPTTAQKIFPMVATFFVLFLVVCMQTRGRRDETETLSPTGFLGGLMVALFPPTVSISAIVIGVSTAIAMNRFAAGYLAATAATAGIGYLFLGRNLMLPMYVALVATPLLVSWLRSTPLVMPMRG